MSVKIVSHTHKVVIGATLALFMAGCFGPTVPYVPKELEKQARSVTVAKSTPYNCRLLGEAEGQDDAEGKIGPSYEKIREGALNDLRNTAADVAHGKRALVAPTHEKLMCSSVGFFGGRSTPFECKPNALGKKVVAQSYRIHAQVFDCGEK